MRTALAVGLWFTPIVLAAQSSRDGSSCDSSAAGTLAQIAGRVTDATGASHLGMSVSISAAAAEGFLGTDSLPRSPVASDGRFVVCVLQSERVQRLTVWLHRVSLADTVIALRDGAVAGDVTWVLPGELFSRAQDRDGSAFRGVVTQSGVPVAGAEIRLVEPRLTQRTDSTGQFRFLGLAGGRVTAEVRRVGRNPVREVVDLPAGAERAREIHLDAVAQVDTVRTVERPVPLHLRDFEYRRTHSTTGRFLTDSVLRANDQVSMTSFLRARIPGIKIVNYRGQEYLAGRLTDKIVLNPSDPRSPGACFVQIYLDDVPMYVGPPQQPMAMSTFSVFNLSAVEYYPTTAMAPLQYRNLNNPCGVLLLYRR